MLAQQLGLALLRAGLGGSSARRFLDLLSRPLEMAVNRVLVSEIAMNLNLRSKFFAKIRKEVGVERVRA
jgi:hypothetical protein